MPDALCVLGTRTRLGRAGTYRAPVGPRFAGYRPRRPSGRDCGALRFTQAVKWAFGQGGRQGLTLSLS